MQTYAAASKERNSSLEFLRLICIFHIVFWHSLSPYLDQISGVNLYSAFISNAMPNSANVIFMLISGYFGLRLNLKKLIKLDLCIIFYDLFFMFLTGDFGFKELLTCLLPITFEKHWFVSCYFVIALFSGFLNQIPEKLSRNAFRNLLLLLLFVFYVMPTVFFHELIEDAGKGVVCMTIMYLAGRYIRLYYGERHFRRDLLAVLFFGNLIVMAALNLILTKLSGNFMGMYCRDNSIFTVVIAVCAFLFFREFDVFIPTVNRLAQSVVYIYCIERYIRTIFGSYANLSEYAENWYFTGIMLVFALMVSSVCFLLHETRHLLLDRFDDFLAKQIMRLFQACAPAVRQAYTKVHDGVLVLISK